MRGCWECRTEDTLDNRGNTCCSDGDDTLADPNDIDIDIDEEYQVFGTRPDKHCCANSISGAKQLGIHNGLCRC